MFYSKKTLIVLSIASCMLLSCAKKRLPKPYEYFRVDLPSHSYTPINQRNELKFDISEYSTISPYSGKEQGFNIDYNKLNARIYMTYMPIDIDSFVVVTEDSRRLAYKHTIKANAIIEEFYSNDTTKVYGLIYKITGNAASAVQFFVTDSTKNFLRGSLYFNNLPNYDSIAPIADYIHKDIEHLIKSLRWKK